MPVADVEPLTVRELIGLLEKQDPEALVVFEYVGGEEVFCAYVGGVSPMFVRPSRVGYGLQRSDEPFEEMVKAVTFAPPHIEITPD